MEKRYKRGTKEVQRYPGGKDACPSPVPYPSLPRSVAGLSVGRVEIVISYFLSYSNIRHCSYCIVADAPGGSLASAPGSVPMGSLRKSGI